MFKPRCHGCGAPTPAPTWRVDEDEYTALCERCAARWRALFTAESAIAEAQARVRATAKYLSSLAVEVRQ